MHDTLSSDVKGTINHHNINEYMGWCFHKTLGILPLRLKCGTEYSEIEYKERIDVSDYYKRPEITNCGWNIKIPTQSEYEIEMNIETVWTPLFKINTSIYSDTLTPTFIVVDNFYKDPDGIRKFALEQKFDDNPKYHKGKRCLNPAFRFPGLKERFEGILGCKIKNWDAYGTNGCFQYCVAGEQAVYHCDQQQYAGVLFLTPDAPPSAGTQFYRSRHTKKMKVAGGEYFKVFKNGHYDGTEFDLVDVVGNVYNRVVLFDARLIHAATQYFGNEMNNGRLFQLFFFDLDK